MHKGRIPSECDSPPPSGWERGAYFAVWAAVAALIVIVLVQSFL